MEHIEQDIQAKCIRLLGEFDKIKTDFEKSDTAAAAAAERGMEILVGIIYQHADGLTREVPEMLTKIVGHIDESGHSSPEQFATSMKRCLEFLATEAKQAGFNITAQHLMAQEKALEDELADKS